MSKMSFTEHPASVGESYLTHLRHASGFSLSLLGAGFACMLHALVPFLCTKTASRIVARLHTRMIVNRSAGISVHRAPASVRARRARAA